MDLSFLQNYMVYSIIGVCLCVGYILKNTVPSKKINQYIPLIMGVVGLLFNVYVQQAINIDVILAGLFSGLASTGMYEAFRNVIDKFKNKEVK